MTNNTHNELTEAMKPYRVVIMESGTTEDRIKVWNHYCGATMAGFNRKIETWANENGYKWTRERTFGNGAIGAADWADFLIKA